MKKQMMICCASVAVGSLLFFMTAFASGNVNPPVSPVKLVFIHHSTGGNWLADPNDSQPYGGLGLALMSNNYYVSATNYGWGPEGVGDRTDIPNWPEWFTGTNSNTILSALFNETAQNVQEYGSWSRLSADPGGENKIILLKSCFPNSDLFGEPDDDAASEISEQYTVSNAKAIYNSLLTTFAAHQDKLFVVITAPPQTEELYAEDYQTPLHRAANACAFNNWLVNVWLKSYPYKNVAVFDYFNLLTGVNNHHYYKNGTIEHVALPGDNMAAYATDRWDAHPNTAGQQKATEEFIPLLNYYYNQWKSADPVTDVLPVADIKLNESDIFFTTHASQTLTLSVGVDPGSYAGVNSDWWLIHLAPGNILRSFDVKEMEFLTGFAPVVQAALFGFPSIPLIELSNLESGTHTFCFAVDMRANALLDSESLCFDCIDVDIN